MEGGYGASPIQSTQNITPETVLRALDFVLVARAIRRHFFSPTAILKQGVQPEVLFAVRTKRERLNSSTVDFVADQFRVHMALIFFRMIKPEDSSRTSELVGEIMPVCIALLESSNATNITLAASVLFHLMHVLDSASPVWSRFAPEVFSTLRTAFMVHREGSVLSVIGCAQNQMLEICCDHDEGRIICKQWLQRLHDVSQGAVANNSCCEVLIIGVAPLLCRLAANRSKALGMELCRLGLLPLITGDFVDIRTQICSVVALIHLILAAFPVISNHGGKIICHLLGTLKDDLTLKDDSHGATEKVQCLRDLGQRGAALSLAVCGDRAYAILDNVDSKSKGYNTAFLQRLEVVRNLAVRLKTETSMT